MSYVFNYTGRKEITSSFMRVSLVGEPPASFVVAEQALKERLFLPDDARVFIEVKPTGSPAVRRFDFGTVGSFGPPPSGTDISDLSGAGIRFCVKVVDPKTNIGRLLGLGESLGGTKSSAKGDEAPKSSILGVRAVALGQRVWRVNYTYSDKCAVLEYNEKIEGFESLLANDDRFRALIFPELIRQVLLKIVLEDQHNDLEGDDWQSRWLRFAVAWHVDGELPPETDANEQAYPRIAMWVDEVISGFCEKQKNASRLLVQIGEQP